MILECGLPSFDLLKNQHGDDLMSIFFSLFTDKKLEGVTAKPKQLIFLSGPSAVGKSPMWRQIGIRFPGYFSKLVIYTSRPARPGEQDGVDYHFRSVQQIEQLALDYPGTFITMPVHKDIQGMDLRDLETVIASGKVPLVELSADWIALLRQKFADKVFSIFLAPLSDEEINSRMMATGKTADEVIYDEMKERQVERATDKEEKQVTRAKSAVEEMKRRGEA